jgi:hypothetical protein
VVTPGSAAAPLPLLGAARLRYGSACHRLLWAPRAVCRGLAVVRVAAPITEFGVGSCPQFVVMAAVAPSSFGVAVNTLFAGWRAELASCRKFGPAARNYAVARLASDVGLRINEARMLDLDDVRWELGRFGKLNVRHGKGSRRKGPKPRLVP